MKKSIVFTSAFIFLICSTFSLSYATGGSFSQNPKMKTLLAKGEKKDWEEKVEKLEKKIKALKEDKEKIEKEIKEDEKELKELKEKKKKKS